MHGVAVLGSVNLDLVATAERLPAPGETVRGHDYREFPGGKGLNQAVAAARIGAAVVLHGAVGDDAAGAALLEVAEREGIDVASVTTVAGSPTGRALITVDGTGENCIVIVPGANGTVAWDRSPTVTVLLAQLEIPLATVVAAFSGARAAGVTTVLNPAPAEPLPGELLAATDIVVPNEHEVEQLGGVSSLLERGAGVVVVTRGAAGVTVHERRSTWHASAFPVEPVDTTGAGDAFCGTLVARLAIGEELPAAIRWAAAAGALATTVPGAVPSLPSHEQVRALLAETR